jgi:hypothetical protein
MKVFISVSGGKKEDEDRVLSSDPEYLRAKAARKIVSDTNDAASKELNDFLDRHERGAMGMTPDHVKAMPEYKRLVSAFNSSFKKMQDTNSKFNREFKRQHAAYRRLHGRQAGS